MMRNRQAFLLAVLALVLLSLACGFPIPTAEPPPVSPTTLPPTALPPESSPTPAPLPTPSPAAGHGSFVVYTGDGGLWIALLEEQALPRQLTAGADSDPLISPDGAWVLFRRQLAPGPSDLPRLELRVVGTDGSGERHLVGPEDLPGETGVPAGGDAAAPIDRLPLQAMWFPDSQAVAFNTHLMIGYGLMHNQDLWRIDLAAREPVQLLQDGEGGNFSFSPDGADMLISSPTAVAVWNLARGEWGPIVSFDFVNTASEYAYQPAPVWSPDGAYGLAAISSSDPFAPGATADLWRIPRRGEAQRLNTLAGQFLSATMDDDFWSPDRAHIAYTLAAEERAAAARDLFIADGDGARAVVYASGALEFLSWHPDSRHFLFWQNAPGEVYLGEIGQPPQRLVPPAEAARVESVNWIDDRAFAYVVGGRGTYEIWVGEIGGAQRTIDTTMAGFAQIAVYP